MRPACTLAQLSGAFWRWQPNPRRFAVPLPQEAFAAAVQSLLPAAWRNDFKMPFVEYIINFPTFQGFSAWLGNSQLHLAWCDTLMLLHSDTECLAQHR